MSRPIPKRLNPFLLAGVICATFAATASTEPAEDIKTLKANFANPPADTRPGCYWYWINDNISTAGLTKDLEAMASVGIGRAYIGHIFDRRDDSDTPVGAVKFMSEEWWQSVQWAVKEADRFNIDIGFFNSPGWSQSGASWIEPHQSMRYLGHSETQVHGGSRIETVLPVPEIDTYPNYGGSSPIRTGPNFTAEDFQDVRVVAYRQPGNTRGRIPTNNIKASGDLPNLQNLFDSNAATTASFTVGSPTTVTVQLSTAAASQPFQTVLLKPIDHGYTMRATVEASDDGTNFRPVTAYQEERGHQGPKNHSEIAIPLGPVTSSHIRVGIQFDGGPAGRQIGVSDISLSDEALLANYARKQLGETSPHTQIPEDAYLWNAQISPTSGTVITSADVIDLTDKVDDSGHLVWDAPPGRWTILRTGMIPIGTQCAPCSPESRGLEIDKMNREHASAIFEGMVGEFLKRTPPEDRKALKYVIADSYETGPQNWSDNFIEKFEQRYGYNPTRFLPVMTGRIVDSPEISDRFLWDLRQLIVESVAYEYVGGLREIANKNGLKLWLENYGHWGFISEFLLYGSQTDEVGGEIWESSNPVSNVECRAAASSAHIYGKKDVFAEIFTSNRNFKQSLASLKRWCDWAFGAGINHAILHVYIHQPDERKPGIIEWFGTAFNRHNTWFAQSKSFNDYIRRGAVMLKAGQSVADVAYYIGEHSPSMTGPMNPPLPPGYDFDHINADVLINHSRVESGRIVTKGGASYAVLVLPPHKEMRPEVIKAIAELVKAGATVIGPKPARSPSLQNYPVCDEQVRHLADTVWGPGQAEIRRVPRTYGDGHVYSGVSLEHVFETEKQLNSKTITPDVTFQPDTNPSVGIAGDGKLGVNRNGGLLFKHRKVGQSHIYFIANTSAVAADTTASFRVHERLPYLCNAVTGEITPAPVFSQVNGRTFIPLNLEPSESVYVLFDEFIDRSSRTKPQPTITRLLTSVDTPWTVHFNGFGAPANTTFNKLIDWTTHPDESIRHYSGTVAYETTFTLDAKPDGKILLDLGDVAILATIIINGKEVGTLWTNPWEIDISDHIQPGQNSLQINVTNAWNNRLAADANKPPAERETYVSRPYSVDKKTPLLPSGLLGPVSVKVEVPHAPGNH